LSFSRALRFICNFICEYFLNSASWADAARDEKSRVQEVAFDLTLIHRRASESSLGYLPRSAKHTDRLREIRSTKVPAEFAKHAVESREF
jgi:hypothetical protein